jgi:peptidoglycan/LPS O-acetylase OafA/YrhL
MLPRGKGMSTGFGAMTLCVVPSSSVLLRAMVEAVWRLYVPKMGSLNGWHKPEMWCALFTALLIGVTAFPKSVVGRFMDSWLMRHLGLLSYALYLAHIPVNIPSFLRSRKGSALRGDSQFDLLSLNIELLLH